MQDRLARLESLLPSRLVGGSDYALVMDAVGQVFQVSPQMVCGPKRTDAVACARMCAVWLFRQHCGKTFYQIRDMLRRPSHSFAVHEVKALERRRSVDAKYDALCRRAEKLLLEKQAPCLKAA